MTPIFYHAKCGGRTLRPDHVWENSIEGYQAVDCPYCHKGGKREWKSVLRNDLMKNVIKAYSRNYNIGGDINYSKAILVMAPDKAQDPEVRFYLDEKMFVMNKSFLRRQLGRSKIQSNNMRIFQGKTSFFVYGEGKGHGVGMCQIGALQMAQKGYKYRKILAHYFPNHLIKDFRQ